MLFLFNKAKIISYLVSVFTVVALFTIANVFIKGNNNAIETNANVSISNNIKSENKNIINFDNLIY